MSSRTRPVRSDLLAAVVLSCTVAGCNGRPPAAPTVSPSIGTPVPPPPAPAPAWEWEGASAFQSISGDRPSCVAPFWQPGATVTISAHVYPFNGRSAMVVRQPATEDCHLLLTESPGQVTGISWPNPDELSCYFSPSLCTPGCHVRAWSSEWHCEDTPPEVWIVDASLNTVARGDRLEGTLTITYTHKPSVRPLATDWRDFTVVSAVNLHKSSR